MQSTPADHLCGVLRDLKANISAGTSAGLTGGETVEFDRASLAASIAFHDASEIASELWVRSALHPADCDTFDARVLDLCDALLRAFDARARFLATARGLASMPCTNGC